MKVFWPLRTYSSPSRFARGLHPAERVGAGVGLGDRPRADLVEREQVERPPLLLRGGALAHDRPGREPDAHAHRGDEPRRAAAQLDDRQEHEAALPAGGPLLAVDGLVVRRCRPCASASMRFLNPSRAIWSMPNVL